MKKLHLYLVFLFVVSWSFSCSDDNNDPYADEKEETIELVNKGIDHFKDVGTNAFADFSDPGLTEWVYGDYYVFVIEKDAPNRTVAHIRSERIGQTVLDQKDPDTNQPFGQQIVETALANPNGAWVPEYRYFNPITTELESKFSYVKIYDDFIFGSGYYVKG